jgi:hypothetical protein
MVGPWRRDHREVSAFAGASIKKPARLLAFLPAEGESRRQRPSSRQDALVGPRSQVDYETRQALFAKDLLALIAVVEGLLG